MALDLLRRAKDADCILTLQCLGELFAAASRKSGKAAEASRFVRDLRSFFPVISADADCLEEAIDAVAAHRLSFWDGLLWATVAKASCKVLITEDLQDGRVLKGVRFVNPFNTKNASLLELALPDQ